MKYIKVNLFCEVLSKFLQDGLKSLFTFMQILGRVT